MADDYEGDDELGSEDAETEATVTCPHCGESIEITVDPSGGDVQEYIDECEACSNPWNVTVTFDVDGHANVEVVALDE